MLKVKLMEFLLISSVNIVWRGKKNNLEVPPTEGESEYFRSCTTRYML